MIETRKTKKVAGVDLSASSFAYVGNLNDTSTWAIALYFPGDPAKTRNLIASALHRFSETKGIPESEWQATWLILVGAAKAHGIPAQHQAPAMAKSKLEKPAPFVVDAEGVDLKAAIAVADLAASRFLHTLGYGDR